MADYVDNYKDWKEGTAGDDFNESIADSSQIVTESINKRLDGSQKSFNDTFGENSPGSRLFTSDMEAIGNGFVDLFNSDLTEEEKAAQDAAAEAAKKAFQNWAERKKEALTALWTGYTMVSVKSIIDEVSPYAATLINDHETGILQALYHKIDDVVDVFIGLDHKTEEDDTTAGGIANGEYGGVENEEEDKKRRKIAAGLAPLESIATDLGEEIIGSLADDPDFMNSFSQLKGIKAIASIAEGVSSTIEDLKKILKYLEPLKPISDILIDFILSFRTGGTSGARAMNTLTERAQFLTQKILADTTGILREFIFNLKIPLPNILIETAKAIDVSDSFALDSPDSINWSDVFGVEGEEEDKETFDKWMGAIVEGEVTEPDWSDASNYSNGLESSLDLIYKNKDPASSWYNSKEREITAEVFHGVFNPVSFLESTGLPGVKQSVFSKLAVSSSRKILEKAVEKAGEEVGIPQLPSPFDNSWIIIPQGYPEAPQEEEEEEDIIEEEEPYTTELLLSSMVFTENSIRKISAELIQ